MFTGYFGYFDVTRTATIANGQTLSSAIVLNGFTPVSILMPAAFTGTALTFQGSLDGTNFFDVKKSDGSALSYTVAQGTFVALDPTLFQGMTAIKLKSGSAEGGARTLTVAVKGL
jgi:hypothetical protein